MRIRESQNQESEKGRVRTSAFIHHPSSFILFRVAAIGLFLAVLLVARETWLPWIGEALVVADPLQAADAVVPLAGGDERSVYAAELFTSGYADWYVATDMPLHLPGVRSSYADLIRQEAIWQGVPEESIVSAPGTVETTVQEAEAVRGLAQARGWTSLLIVTDPFHTRRARMIFRDTFEGTGITTVVRPVEGSWYRAEAWWRSLDGLRETWTEALKLGLYVVGYRT